VAELTLLGHGSNLLTPSLKDISGNRARRVRVGRRDTAGVRLRTGVLAATRQPLAATFLGTVAAALCAGVWALVMTHVLAWRWGPWVGALDVPFWVTTAPLTALAFATAIRVFTQTPLLETRKKLGRTAKLMGGGALVLWCGLTVAPLVVAYPPLDKVQDATLGRERPLAGAARPLSAAGQSRDRGPVGDGRGGTQFATHLTRAGE